MKKLHNISIRFKVIIIVNGVLLLAFIFAAILIRRLVYERTVSEKITTTEILMQSLVHDINYTYEQRESMSVQVVINKYITYYRMIKNISFYDNRLVNTADSIPSNIDKQTQNPLILAAIESGKPTTIVTRFNSYNIKVASISPIFQGTKIVGAVSMEISVDDINATLKRIDRSMLLIIVSLLSVASLLLFVLLKKTILQRLSNLLKATHQIAQGEYDINIPQMSSDEIGELASAFIQMTRDVKKSRNDLQDYSEHLEEIVQDRTAELQKAYDELKNTQSQLVLSEKMASLGILIAGIAHEINTPVGAINNVAKNVYVKIIALSKSLKEMETKRSITTCNIMPFLDYVIENYKDSPLNISLKKKKEIENYLKDKGVNRYKDVASTLIKLNLLESKKIENYLDCIKDENSMEISESFGDIIRAAKVCETSSQKIADIVRALKYYAYTDKDKLERININESLENSLILLSNKLKYRVEIITSLEERLHPVTCTSEINQIWPNLINNSYDAICEMGEGYRGEIKIETLNAYDNVVIRITDNGIGIKSDLINKVFDPFFTTKDIGKGTGLGLSIVSGIIKKHNGIVRVESRKGFTLFEISLPAETPVVAEYEEAF